MTSKENRRYLGPLLLVLACLAAFFTTWIAYRSTQSIRSGYQGKLMSIVISYSNVIREQIVTGSLHRIETGAKSLLSDEDVLSVIVYDGQGKILVQVQDREALQALGWTGELPTVDPLLNPPGIVFKQNSIIASRSHTVFNAQGQTIGGVTVHMNRNPEQKLVRRALTSTLLLGFVVFLLAMIPVRLLVRRIYRNTENLERVNRELEQANQIKERFLANMSHEIRTPMNSIIGFTELLEESELDTEQQEWVSVIQHNGKQLIHLINQILSFSRLEADKMELCLREVDLRTLMSQVYHSFKHLAEKKGLEFDLQIDPLAPVLVHTDPDALVQCLNNLLSNALKFTESGRVALRVRFQENTVQKDSGQLILVVSDTGRGIPESRQIDIFEAFSQVEGSDSYQFQGTGLGLSITKSIMNLMQGTITLVSKPGEGSDFTLTFPCTTPPPTQTELPLHPDSTADANELLGTQRERINRLRVIVAEDNAFNQKLILKILAKCGVQADCVPDGLALMQALSLQSYDLILMDINMPDLDGLEATRRIRNLDSHRHTRIVAVSASRNDAFVDHCFQAGMDGFIGKPFRQHDIANVLLATLEQPGLTQSDSF